MNKKILASALAAGLISISAGANAGVLTFDTLPGDAPGIGFSDYGGFLWSNFFALNPDTNPSGTSGFYSGSGYATGRVSEPNVAFNGNGTQATVRRNGGGNFVFNGGYFSGAWRNGLQVTLEGVMGSQVVSKTITVGITDPLAAQWFDFDWTIEELRITSAGGERARTDFPNEAFQFVLDNFTFDEQRNNNVPEPGALALLGIGLAGLSLTRRRKSTS